MTLLQLQYFQALARTLHYTRTAERLRISQPSLSAAIGDLERELGVKLFQKESRKVSLTLDGQRFFSYVDQAMYLLQEGVDLMQESAQTAQQVVRLGYFQSIASTIIPELVKGFYKQEETTHILFHFTEVSSYDVLSRIRSGALDLGFSFHQAAWAQSVPVEHQILYLAVPVNHHLADRDCVSFADFATEPLIALGQDSSLRVNLDEAFSRHGMIPRNVFEVRECNAALQYVGLGFGVSVLPQMPAINSDKISMLPIKDPEGDFTRTIYFTCCKGRTLPLAAQKVKDYILHHFSPPSAPA